MQEPIRDDESREVSFGADRLSAALRGEMRTLVERLIREELVEALGAGRYERNPERRGYQHSPRERTITTGLGPVTLTVPRGRLRNKNLYARRAESTRVRAPRSTRHPPPTDATSWWRRRGGSAARRARRGGYPTRTFPATGAPTR